MGETGLDDAGARIDVVAVYIASRTGAEATEFARAADHLGSVLAQSGITIVYGGAKVGLMGRVADAAVRGDGEVIGVVPSVLNHDDYVHPGVAELRVVDTMRERKELIADLADAAIAGPGGPGTVEELLEFFTATQIGLHHKPCGLLNVAGYYDQLLSFLDRSVDAGFLKEKHRGALIASEDAEDLVARLAALARERGGP